MTNRTKMASYRLPPSLLDALEEAKWRLKLPKTEIVETALREFLARNKEENHDDQVLRDQ